MRKLISFLLILLITLASCGPKPAYKTRKGRKKQKYLNMHQYDHNKRDDVLKKEMKNPKKKKNKRKKYKFDAP